jgi:hypothetical protein
MYDSLIILIVPKCKYQLEIAALQVDNKLFENNCGSCPVFAYQDTGLRQASTTRLYYIPFGSIGTGECYEPLPLPEIADSEERPQPVLRPVTP